MHILLSKKRRRKNTVTQKNTLVWLLVIVLVVMLIGSSSQSIGNFDLSNFDLQEAWDRWFGGNGDKGLVEVNKALDFALTNEYAGSALTSKTLIILDSDGETQLESLTTGADGTISSAFLYPSDKKIYVKYEDSNDKQIFPITVPRMRASDAESATVNTIALKSFTIGTYTESTLHVGATAIADAGSYNFTASGDTPTFTMRIANSGNDNTGVKDSYDPLYKHNWWTCIYVTFSGTEYERVLVYGFGNDFTLGTTHYVASRLNAYELTREVDGTTIKSDGVDTFSFSLDGSGLTDACSVTMQIYIKTYTDPDYCQTHGGAFGVESVELDEITVTLQH
jgi:hypothetical protein